MVIIVFVNAHNYAGGMLGYPMFDSFHIETELASLLTLLPLIFTFTTVLNIMCK